MRKRASIFFIAGAVLVLFGAGCGSTEREAVAPPSPAPTMTLPKTHPSPSAPEWLAAGATNSVAAITGAPNASIGITGTVVAEDHDVDGPRAVTPDREGPAHATAPPHA